MKKLKRRYVTKRKMQEWENYFTLKESSNLDMTFGDFVKSKIIVKGVIFVFFRLIELCVSIYYTLSWLD